MANIFRISQVLSVADNIDGDRIKVRLYPEDDTVSSINDLPYCFPLIPKMVHVKPKVNEYVFVVTSDSKEANTQRYYIGPIISQPTHMELEREYIGATSVLNNSYVGADPAPSMNPETKGAFMNSEDIGFEGRRHTGVQLTDRDVRVKAGVKVHGRGENEVYFNTKNPAYLKLDYNEDEQLSGGRTYNSTATLVADQINLIGTNAKDYFNVTDRDDLISDDVMKEIIEKAHQLPYGDILIEFLSLFREAFLKHVHPYPTLPPCVDSTVLRVQGYDLNKILSETVKIN